MDADVQQRKAAGEAVRIARTVKRLSQRELAQAAEIELWKVFKLEQGLRSLSTEETQRLWSALSS